MEQAQQRALATGLAGVQTRLRHGALVETLTELETDVRLFVLGKREPSPTPLTRNWSGPARC